MGLLGALDRVRRTALQWKGYATFGRRVAVFGDFTVVNPRNVAIGEGCAINHGVFILARNRIEIGNGVILSTGCRLIDAALDVTGFAHRSDHPYLDSFIKIEDGAWIGAGAIVLPGVTVGTKSVVGAGAVVTRDVPAFTIVAGNPARPIGRTDR